MWYFTYFMQSNCKLSLQYQVPIRSNMPRSQKSSQSSSSVENISPDINLDFEENAPFQEGVISDMFQRPDKTFKTQKN